jgi:hypothetical protein
MTLGALGGAVKPLTRAEVIKLAEDSPVTTLPMLGRALGVSEPVIRAQARSGELEKMGVRVLRLGAQYRVPTADILRVLGIDPETIQPHPVARSRSSSPERPPDVTRGSMWSMAAGRTGRVAPSCTRRAAAVQG